MSTKPPAFQFYPDDFMGGTSDMTQAEVGAYILLLCYQWNHGSAPVQPERQQIVARGSVSAHVLEKFEKTPDGKLLNMRLENERQKQAQFREQQRLKGVASGKSRRTTVEQRLNHGSSPVGTECEPKVNSPSPSPSTAEREYAEPSRPTEQEVISYASLIGLIEWKAKDWFQEMEGCGWLDHQRRPVVKWQAVLLRVKTKWEADGRPKSPPVAKASPAGSGAVPAVPIWKQIQHLEEEISKHPANHQSVFHKANCTELERAALKSLRQKLASLKDQQMGGGAA